MNHIFRIRIAFALVAMLASIGVATRAQSDSRRSTIAITYPLNQTIEVAFHGTTRLPRLFSTRLLTMPGTNSARWL